MIKESKDRLRAVLFNFEARQRGASAEDALSPDEDKFKSLLVIMENETMSYRSASKIVGQVKLDKLMEEGVIRSYKPDGESNRKWRINAADCYRHVRPRLKQVLNNANAS